jgi:hypothetical protein
MLSRVRMVAWGLPGPGIEQYHGVRGRTSQGTSQTWESSYRMEGASRPSLSYLESDLKADVSGR